MATTVQAKQELEVSIMAAAKALNKAKSADEIRAAWREHLGLGHRVLGRLLCGQNPASIIAKKLEG